MRGEAGERLGGEEAEGQRSATMCIKPERVVME
jgi:hypothetical protein